MRVMMVKEFGPPEVLAPVEVPDPAPGPGELRVRVRAAGVQPADCAVRSGWAPPGYAPVLPVVPGNEFAGVVDAVGEGVAEFVPGDEVLGFRVLECYAERVVVPASQAVRKPASMPWEVAGSLSASGQTAHTAVEALGVAPGETLLVHAAAGGVGTMAVQLARLRGARVIGTASEANHPYLRELGAEPVLYGPGLAERVRELAPDGVDAALDAAGGDAVDASLELVRDRARVGTLVAFDRIAALGVRPIRSQRSAERLDELVRLWTTGRLVVHVRKVYRLEGAAAAHREVEARHGRGKVVLMLD